MKALRLFILFLCVVPLLSCKPKPQVKWNAYTPEAFTQALASGKPAVVDFYAAWCGPCMEMKETTFADPRVIDALEPFIRIKADMSFTRSPKIQKISDAHDIRGLPTLILYDPSGKEYQRFNGYISPDQFLDTLQKFKSRFRI